MVAPGCPFGRPGLRPVFFRSDFGAGLPSPSDEGGLEEFFEFCLTRAASSAICSRRSATSPSACATRARNAAISASRSASSFRSRAFAARNPAASPGGPGVSNTCAVHHSRPSVINATRRAGSRARLVPTPTPHLSSYLDTGNAVSCTAKPLSNSLGPGNGHAVSIKEYDPSLLLSRRTDDQPNAFAADGLLPHKFFSGFQGSLDLPDVNRPTGARINQSRYQAIHRLPLSAAALLSLADNSLTVL